MSSEYIFAIEGLSSLGFVDDLPEKIRRAARIAINQTADHARTYSANTIRRKVAFPADYLKPSTGRLAVRKRATNADLEASIVGRQRPTSLARFVTGTPGRKAGVSAQVAPRVTKQMRRAFLIKLRAGTANIETKFNMGLAIRLRPGERIENKRQMVRIEKGLYLLYGPSVDQVFRSIRPEVAGNAVTFLEDEFLRLVEVDL